MIQSFAGNTNDKQKYLSAGLSVLLLLLFLDADTVIRKNGSSCANNVTSVYLTDFNLRLEDPRIVGVPANIISFLLRIFQ